MNAQAGANLSQEEWEYENDLPFLACLAAIELDNLIKDKPMELAPVKQLIKEISDVENVLSKSETMEGFLFAPIDPATAVALNYAIAESAGSHKKSKLSELRTETILVVKNLEQLVENPQNFKAEEGGLDKLNMLKSFCLALSKHALASEPPYEAESQQDQQQDLWG